MENIRKRQHSNKALTYVRITNSIEIVKAKFNDIIQFLNKNKEINKQLTTEMKTHLNYVKDYWEKPDYNKKENYLKIFNMKKHYSYITGKIKNDTLNKMWEDYLKSGEELNSYISCLAVICYGGL